MCAPAPGSCSAGHLQPPLDCPAALAAYLAAVTAYYGEAVTQFGFGKTVFVFL